MTYIPQAARFPVVWLLAFLAFSTFLPAQTITGVTARGEYTDQVTFSVLSEPGFNISATLNGAAVPLDTAQRVARMDFYELIALRTPTAGGTTTSNVVPFVIISSNRGSPERGLIEWTPYPLISSTAGEFAGGHLDLIMPRNYPGDLEIPVVAWVRDAEGHAIRGNGQVQAAGFGGQDIRILRGAGSGLLAPVPAGGDLQYHATLHGLSASKTVTIDEPTVWTPVSGTLNGASAWPPNSRIHVQGDIAIPAGATLTIFEGTIVKLEPRANILNSGSVVINGTVDNPVVLTATNRVAPEVHTHAWGGFVMTAATASLTANGAILVGGGGAPSWNFSPGPSHRSEQAVLLVQSGARAYLTNCAVIHSAGQVGNGYFSDVIYDHCLLQKAVTCGEYEGGLVVVNHSALIEFPEDNGVVNADIADADYDGIYFTEGTHILLNSLFGFAKDDAIDSGSGGAGTMWVSNCWVEAALHEAQAWSGGGRVTATYDTVNINNGQGLECGWSTGNNSPLVFADRLLSLANSVGIRFGDNYTSIGDNHQGTLTVTNSLSLYNYRDVFGWTWSDWVYRAADMDLRGNLLTQPNAYHPDNALWNPAADAWRLAPFMRTAPEAPVGIGIAAWTDQSGSARIPEGVPVRLSTFTTNTVSVDYEVQDTTPAVIASGTLTFQPGETVKRIALNPSLPPDFNLVRVRLSNPVNGELTGATRHFVVNTEEPQAPDGTLMARNSVWKYHNLGQDLGTAWRAPSYDDSAWSSGPGSLGFDTGSPPNTSFDIGPSTARYPTIYFRATFRVDDPAEFGSLAVGLRRDDGAVVYFNGAEAFRSNMPTGPVTYNTFTGASTPSETEYAPFNVPMSFVQPGLNVVAVEVHQADATSSDLHFDLEIVGLSPGPPEVELIARGAVWKYHDLAQDLGTAWRMPGYNDAAWAEGPAELGFGDGGEPTVVNGGPSGSRTPTIYFRRTIQIPSLAGIDVLRIGIRRDDGAVIYVNGAEVYRDANIPPGLVTYGTYTGSTTPSETEYAPATASAANLVVGANVIAVEVHQADAGSSDLSFDLELFGAAGPSTELNWVNFGEELLLYWSDPDFEVERAPEVTGPWNLWPGPSPKEVLPTDPRQFYRLRGF